MSDRSAIEWTDATWNPVRGCTKISPGCAHCYAETFAERFRGVAGHPYEHGFDLRLVPDKLSEPLRWPGRRTVFVNSMSDLFHEEVPEAYILAVAAVMKATPWHTYQVLTKRADRLHRLLNGPLRFGGSLPNVWWGVSAENRKHGLPRAQLLRAAPARVRFLSVEPLLEDIGDLPLDGIHWVIVGGESGHGARPMAAPWVASIRDRCAAARVPFFFKQWGGVQKKRNGRMLGGRTYDEMPTRSSAPIPDAEARRVLGARFDVIARGFSPDPIPLRPPRMAPATESASVQ
jgi:protein gp37